MQQKSSKLRPVHIETKDSIEDLDPIVHNTSSILNQISPVYRQQEIDKTGGNVNVINMYSCEQHWNNILLHFIYFLRRQYNHASKYFSVSLQIKLEYEKTRICLIYVHSKAKIYFCWRWIRKCTTFVENSNIQ